MPEGHCGLVLGSGPNTEVWRTRGWATLDLQARVGADFTADANYLEDIIPPACLDYVCAENIRFDPKGEQGVGRGRLLDQANKVLKPGGFLIIQTAHKENIPGTTVPDRAKYVNQMRDHGFATVVEVSTLYSLPGAAHMKEQRVVYYGKKLAQGHVSSVQRPLQN